MNLKEPLKMFETIVDGTRHVLEFAKICSCRKLLLASSGAVYGRQPIELERVSEDYLGAPDPVHAASAYGEGKRVAELLVSQTGAAAGFEVKIARGFAFLGPNLPLDGTYAAGNFIRDAIAGGPIRIAGDGTPMRSFLYGSDLAVWLWIILFRGRPSRAYNVGSEQYISISGLAEMIAKQTSVGVEVAKAPTLGVLPERYVPVEQPRSERTWIESGSLY